MTDPLIVDAYAGDGAKNWTALAAAGAPWCGAMLKATQGTYYTGGTWFPGAWRMVKLAGVHANRGAGWVRGAYHYLSTTLSGRNQADYFVAALNRAGGWDSTDILAVDVERAGQRSTISAQGVIDCVSSFAERTRELTGRWMMLYGGSWLRDLGITSRMGCKYLWIARYSGLLPAEAYTRIGWDRNSLAMWQYAGLAGGGKMEPADPAQRLKGYPFEAPGCGPIDISAVVLPGGIAALA